MIKYFIIQHIDAIITTIGGVICTIVGYKGFRKIDASKHIKLLKILGPCVIGFGLLNFFLTLAAPVEWRRVSTSDGIASVEFPGTPKHNKQTHKLQGQAIRTIGWVYDIPGKDISLRISHSDVLVEEAEILDTERFNFIKQYFIEQGFHLLSESTGTYGTTPGYSLHMEMGNGESVLWMRLAFVDARIYRIICSTGKSFRDDPVVVKFMESFQVKTTAASIGRSNIID